MRCMGTTPVHLSVTDRKISPRAREDAAFFFD
jgi:hypothetical protein